MGSRPHIPPQPLPAGWTPVLANTRELVEVLAALSPYVVFIALIVWSAVAELKERARAGRARPPERDS